MWTVYFRNTELWHISAHFRQSLFVSLQFDYRYSSCGSCRMETIEVQVLVSKSMQVFHCPKLEVLCDRQNAVTISKERTIFLNRSKHIFHDLKFQPIFSYLSIISRCCQSNPQQSSHVVYFNLVHVSLNHKSFHPIAVSICPSSSHRNSIQ